MRFHLSSIPIFVIFIIPTFTFPTSETVSTIYNGDSIDTHGQNSVLEGIDYPYIALLIHKDKPQCGATIIKPNVVLTVAHCVHTVLPSNMKVKGGTLWKFETTSGNIQIKNVSNIILHDKFDKTIIHKNDIAILFLESNFIMTTFVNTINIATKVQRTESFNADVRFFGWGYTKTGEQSNVLQVAEMNLISKEKCKRKVSIMRNVVIDDTMICAISENKDISSCAGDSGGPLVTTTYWPEKTDILIGAVSFGVPSPANQYSCLPEFPIVFVDFVTFTPWINEKIGISVPSGCIPMKKKWFWKFKKF